MSTNTTNQTKVIDLEDLDTLRQLGNALVTTDQSVSDLITAQGIDPLETLALFLEQVLATHFDIFACRMCGSWYFGDKAHVDECPDCADTG